MKLCVCGCGKLASSAIDGWRESCVTSILLDIRKLQNLKPADLVVVAALAHDAGAERLARAIVGALPFEPNYEGLMQ